MLRNLYNRAFGSALGDNAWYICVEVFWSTIFAGALTFAGAYAIRLGASNTEVSLLTSLTALTAALVLMPTGHFLQKRRRPKNWILAGLMLYRVGTLLFVLLPWMELGLPKGTLFVIIFTLLTFPMHFFNLGFIPLLAEAIPEPQRADAFTARNVVQGAAMSLSTLLLGLWLGRVVYPVNYQVLFMFGFVTAMVSLYYLAKVRVPDARPPAPGAAEAGARRQSLIKRGAATLTTPFKQQAFRRIFFNSFVFSLGLWAAAPLYLLYPVRALGASEDWLGAYGAIGNLATIFGYLFWRRVINRWGEPKVLRYTVLGMGFFPFLVGSTPSLNLILVLVGLNGLIIAGFNLSHFNTFLKAIPEGERHNQTALYMTLMNVGAFVAPMVAVWLGGEHYGFGAVLVVCGLLTLAGSLSFWLWPLGDLPQPEPQLHPEEG
jgi:MFS family permease